VNLATNALRHGEPPFIVEADRENDGRVELRFLDHGAGISDADRASLFEPFRVEGEGSVGLGLAIVRALVEAHGGEVSYRPNSPRGAVFSVSLPAGRPS
jgi:signal transduction histidine kinase